MRLASCILIAVILTTCITLRTYAKYVTSDSANDSARVAKWGVNIVVEGSLFSNAYYDENRGNTPSSTWSTNYTSDHISVATSTNGDENIIAPGTKSDTGLHFSISGKPEVATQITFEADYDSAQDIYLSLGSYGTMQKILSHDEYVQLNESERNSKLESLKTYYAGKHLFVSTDKVSYYNIDPERDEFGIYIAYLKNDPNANLYVLNTLFDIPLGGYYPVEYMFNGEKYSSTHDLLDEISSLINTSGGNYPANTDLSTVLAESGEFDISWIWPYEENSNKNEADIFLGNIIANQGVKDNLVYFNDEGYALHPYYRDDKVFVYFDEYDFEYAIANTTTSFGFNISVIQVD